MAHIFLLLRKNLFVVVVVCIYLFINLLLKIENNSLYVVATLDSDSPSGEVTVAVCFNDFPHLILWSFPLRYSVSEEPAQFYFSSVFIFKPG